jgi:hypothetical protein
MLSKWTYLLIILLIVFGSFYFVGTIIGSQGIAYLEWLSVSTDLWANLFASLVVIVVIERIIHRSQQERSRISTTYIRGRILHVLVELMENMRVPSNWRERLEEEDNFYDFYEDLRNSREQGLLEIETIVDNYSHFLEPELRNDVFVLVSILRSYDFIDFRNRDAWSLADAARFSATVMSQSRQIVEGHNLLRDMGVTTSFREGEPPRVTLGNSGVCEETQYRLYSEWQTEAIAFRDECSRMSRLGRSHE